MLECDVTVNERCTNLYTTGRGPFSGPAAFVLVAMGMPIADYHSQLTQNYARWYPTGHPKSVHYGVSATGAVYSYVDDANTAWGLDALHNPTWPGIVAAPDPASQFLFIGLEGAGVLGGVALTNLAHLLCCLSNAHSLALDETTVIVARDLNDTLVDPWSVPAGLIALAQSVCLEAGSVNDLVACCAETRADIAALEIRMGAAEDAIEAIMATGGLIDGLQTQITGLQAGLTELQERVLTLEALAGGQAQQYANLAQAIALMQVCINKVCPPDTAEANIEYYGLALNTTALTPNWLNLPTQVSDTVPSSVMIGPLWTATLAAGTYLVEGYARFAVGDWCAGKVAWLDAVVDSGAIRLDTESIAAGGPQTITLQGSATINAPPDSHVHLSLQYNDGTAMSRTVDLAWIKITKI